ncbi:MAG TPA: hypothetical protein VFO76_02270 [Candidatus Kapabacteria bacterium]|nr:hypothetical protein [Candidatus Kapabacteria bacterium]
MNLRDEEILQNYFDRKMTAPEEQNFLIDVAARDDMRLAFRSNLELLKAVRADKDAASIALVRSSTLASLGLGAGLLPNALKEQEAAQASVAQASIVKTGGLWNLIRRPASMLVMGLLAGSAITYSLLPASTPESAQQLSPPAAQSPATITITEPSKDIPNPAQHESVKNAEATHSAKPAIAAKATTPKQTITPEEMPLVKKTKSSSIQVQTTVHPPSENQK